MYGNADYRRVMNTPQSIPSHDAITSRARKIWESSGQIDGRDLNNWLQAESELLDEASANTREKGSAEDSAGNNSRSVPAPVQPPPTPWPHDPGNRGNIPNPGKQARNRR
jgi:hypothetical protein